MTTARRWVAKAFGGPEVLEEISLELAEPGHGEVTVAVRAAGMNPADYKMFASGDDEARLPVSIGFEVAGVIARVGADTEIGSGSSTLGGEVVAFQLSDGYSTALNVPAGDVFAKSPGLSFPQAANLLLVGTTAADALHLVGVSRGDTVLVHGAAGGVGTSVIQQAAALGATAIGSASERNFDAVRGFGATPVAYGPGLEERVREAAPDGIDTAIDTVGTDEAVDVSLALVPDRGRVVTIAAFARAKQEGFCFVGRGNPDSQPYREAVRRSVLDLAAAGRLTVPIGQTFPFDQAPAEVAALRGRHGYGKLALVVG